MHVKPARFVVIVRLSKIVFSSIDLITVLFIETTTLHVSYIIPVHLEISVFEVVFEVISTIIVLNSKKYARNIFHFIRSNSRSNFVQILSGNILAVLI